MVGKKYGGVLKWKYPQLAGLFHGKSHLEMDDKSGYPYDSGNLHMCHGEVTMGLLWFMVYGHPSQHVFSDSLNPDGLMRIQNPPFLGRYLGRDFGAENPW